MNRLIILSFFVRKNAPGFRAETNSVLLCMFLVFLVYCVPVSAQERAGDVLKTFEQKELLPQEILPKKPIIQRNKLVPAAPHTGGEDRHVLVIKFKIEGANLVNEAELNAVISRYEGKKMSLDDIHSAADLITAMYRAKGYIIANAIVPEQDIKNGVVLIRVIEGKVDKISVTGNKSYSTSFISNHLERVRIDPSLKEARLERAILLLNDFSSLNVHTLLNAGKNPGTTDLIASVTDSMPISASITYDNYGSKSLSKNRLGANIDLGNLAVNGDLLMLRGVMGIDRMDPNRLSFGRLEYQLPVGYNGCKVGGYYANSLYKISGSLDTLNINGKANMAGIYASYPVIKRSDQSLVIRAGFDYKDVYDYLMDAPNSKDRLRTISIGMSHDSQDSLRGRNFIGLNYLMGLPGFLAGTGSHDQGSSRVDGDGQYNKITLDIARAQKLIGYNFMILRASGQYSPNNLFVAEQFSLGGPGSVRGFTSSQTNGDYGYLLSTELQLSPFYPDSNVLHQKLGDTVKFVLFGDHGGAFKNSIQPGESRSGYLTSIGTGIRFYYGRNFSVTSDFAIPLRNGDFRLSSGTTYIQTVLSY